MTRGRIQHAAQQQKRSMKKFKLDNRHDMPASCWRKAVNDALQTCKVGGTEVVVEHCSVEQDALEALTRVCCLQDFILARSISCTQKC